MKEEPSPDPAVSQDLADAWITEDTRALARAVAALRDEDEALRFLRDLCTIRELQEFGHRWHVARLLVAGTAYHEISQRTGASSATISRVNHWLRYGRGGYGVLIERLSSEAGRRLAKRGRP